MSMIFLYLQTSLVLPRNKDLHLVLDYKYDASPSRPNPFSQFIRSPSKKFPPLVLQLDYSQLLT